jgi:hypothetical protein
MKETIYIVWSRRNSHFIATVWRKACDLLRVPPETRDGPMGLSAVRERADFSKDTEAFVEAACDAGRLDHVVLSHQCVRTIRISNISQECMSTKYFNNTPITPETDYERQLDHFHHNEILQCCFLFGSV